MSVSGGSQVVAVVNYNRRVLDICSHPSKRDTNGTVTTQNLEP